jgi:hypothetical protein
MRAPRHRVSLLLAVGLAVLTGPVKLDAQTTPPRALDCGPSIVKVGDLVAVNVGYPDRNAGPAAVRVRLVDGTGALRLGVRFVLSPGQARSVRWTVPASTTGAPVLVRGEVLVDSGPEVLRMNGTFQLFGAGLTYGPNFECSGDTGGRGPV